MRYIVILCLFSLIACGHKPPTDPPHPTFPIPISEAIARFSSMADAGWVVSRWDDGRAERVGDSLIWTGIAMAALPCADGEPYEAALQQMLTSTGGHLYRHPSLPSEWSLDGALGLYYGVSERVKRCNSATWGPLMVQHAAAVELPPRFDVVRSALIAELGAGPAPSEHDRGELGTEVAAWALADVVTRSAAFRLHLGFLALSVVDAPKGKAAFCGAIGRAKMPLLDHFCGKGGLAEWTAAFHYDAWEYAHQRSPAWETPDGAPGLHTPALDYLLAYQLLL